MIELLGTTFSVVAFIVGLFTPLDPTTRTWWLCIAVGFLAFVWIAHFRAPLRAGLAGVLPDALTGRLRPSSDPFIPLAEAARLAYEEHRDERIGIMVQRSDDGALSYMAQWIADQGAPIYGKREPSAATERLPTDLLAAGGITSEADRFERDGWDTYEGLAVKRREFQEALLKTA